MKGDEFSVKKKQIINKCVLGECFKKGLKVVTYFKASETFPKASECNVNTGVYARSELGKSALASPIKNVLKKKKRSFVALKILHVCVSRVSFDCRRSRPPGLSSLLYFVLKKKEKVG